MATPLSAGTLAALASQAAVPNYRPERLTAGILHFGIGNFHRAHQAVYLDDLFNLGLDHDWALVGAGVRDADIRMRDTLRAQDYLTTVVEQEAASSSARITASLVDFLPPGDARAIIERLADPAIRIVSLTVTEGGYYVDPATGRFDAAHPDMVHDAANPDRPRTAVGAMIAALRRRRDAGCGPFTALSCDNLQGNGAVLRRTVVSLARLSDPALADWIDSRGAFPNSMVDSIAPATGPKELALVRSLGIDDAAPVTHENFRQWVIEDAFCAGRPEWDRAGATFSDRVHDYETMKLRILNAGHQLLANAGEILSVETIAGCMAHPAIAAFLGKALRTEIAPHVAPTPDMTPEAYIALIERRFSNPAVVDTVRRVAFDGSSRHPGFLLPVVRDALAAGAPVAGLALAEAMWARMCAGVREDGSAIEPNDPQWDALSRAALAARETPAAWLAQRSIYGDLGDSAAFAGAFSRWLRRIWSDGAKAALRDYAAGA
jgi:mannitol 2-dehydrogenase